MIKINKASANDLMGTNRALVSVAQISGAPSLCSSLKTIIIIKYLHFFGKIKYFAYFAYFLNILPTYRVSNEFVDDYV